MLTGAPSPFLQLLEVALCGSAIAGGDAVARGLPGNLRYPPDSPFTSSGIQTRFAVMDYLAVVSEPSGELLLAAGGIGLRPQVVSARIIHFSVGIRVFACHCPQTGIMTSIMESKKLYTKDSDLEIFGKMEKLLEQQGKSVSEFFADTARNFVEAHERTVEIELQGATRKRIFKGQQLYWDEGSLIQTGVFYTPKGSFVYWSYSYGDREKFGVYGSLSQLRADNYGDFEGDQGEATWKQVEEAYAELMGQEIVERLDI